MRPITILILLPPGEETSRLREYFEKRGHQLHIAETIAGAIREARRCAPTVSFVDPAIASEWSASCETLRAGVGRATYVIALSDVPLQKGWQVAFDFLLHAAVRAP